MTRISNKEDFSKFRAAPDLSFANRSSSFWSKVVTMCFEFLCCQLTHKTPLTSKWWSRRCVFFLKMLPFWIKTPFLTAMLDEAVLQTTLLDFKGLLKYLLEIQGSMMFDKIIKPLKLDQIGPNWIRFDQMTWEWFEDDLGISRATLDTLAVCSL